MIFDFEWPWKVKPATVKLFSGILIFFKKGLLKSTVVAIKMIFSHHKLPFTQQPLTFQAHKFLGANTSSYTGDRDWSFNVRVTYDAHHNPAIRGKYMYAPSTDGLHGLVLINNEKKDELVLRHFLSAKNDNIFRLCFINVAINEQNKRPMIINNIILKIISNFKV